jgi:zinc protease
MKSRARAALAAFTLSLLPAFAPAQPTQPATTAQVTEFRLDNGMRVIVNEDHRAPTVAHMIWYRVGSIDETNGTTGVAHALEHMMFKGTKDLKPGEFSQRVAELGGRENAFTSKDYTAYFEHIEKSQLAKVMALEADRMHNLQFDENEFAKEMRVVKEERRLRTDDQPIALLHEALYATAFAAHPYRHPVIGWPSDLDHMTLADVRNWYHMWYAPNNAVMVVSGDVGPEQVHVLAQEYFGKYQGQPIPRGKPQDEPPQRGIKRVTVRAPAENPYVALAFKVPALHDIERDDDALALDVLAAVLDGYDNARLSAKLVRTDRVAYDVDASYSGIARGPVLFILDGTPAAGVTTEQLEKLLRGEVERVAREGVSEAELNRVKNQLIADEIYKRDSVFGQAMEIGAMEMTGLSYTQIDRLIERLRTVTSAQVQAVARRYFGDDALTVGTLVPLPLSGKKPAPATAPNEPLR